MLFRQTKIILEFAIMIFGTTRTILKYALNSGVLGLGFHSHKSTILGEALKNGGATATGWNFDWDGRQKLAQNLHATQRHIILIRHGQCNLSDPEQILTELGRHQSELTGKRLQQLEWPITEMITSKLSRAQETGRIISTFLPPALSIREDVALNEGSPVQPVPTEYWNIDSETVAADGARIDAAFANYFYRPDAEQETDSYTVIVSHANVIRYFMCRVLQFDTIGWLRFSLHNGSITWLSINATGAVRLRCVGEAGYMEPAALTQMNFREENKCASI